MELFPSELEVWSLNYRTMREEPQKYAKPIQFFLNLRPYLLQPSRLLCPWDSPEKNTEAACHALAPGGSRGSSRPRSNSCVSHFLLWQASSVPLASPLVVAQLLSHVQLFATPWTTVCQASLSPRVYSNIMGI